MPLAISPHKALLRPKSKLQTNAVDSKYAAEDIGAYIAIRNDLLAEAEELKTRAKIDSAAVANDFVANCLKPARTPYGSQSLPDADAKRERRRCEAIRNRIRELRTILA
jgi:hypothetical protein